MPDERVFHHATPASRALPAHLALGRRHAVWVTRARFVPHPSATRCGLPPTAPAAAVIDQARDRDDSGAKGIESNVCAARRLGGGRPECHAGGFLWNRGPVVTRPAREWIVGSPAIRRQVARRTRRMALGRPHAVSVTRARILSRKRPQARTVSVSELQVLDGRDVKGQVAAIERQRMLGRPIGALASRHDGTFVATEGSRL